MTTCQSFLTSAIQQLCSSGFPIRVRLVGGYFGQNDNYKINIFGTKWWGEMGGQANFSDSGGDSPPITPTQWKPCLFL